MAFQSAEVILDKFGRPIFVLPEELPEGECLLQLHDGFIDFTIGGRTIGHLENLMPELVALVHLQPQVGLIVYADESKPCPDHLTHVARVNSHLSA